MLSDRQKARIEREKATARNEQRMRGRYQNSRPRVASGMEAVRDSSFPTMRPSTQHQIFKIIEKGAKGVNVAGAALLASGLIDPDRAEGRRSDLAAQRTRQKYAGKTSPGGVTYASDSGKDAAQAIEREKRKREQAKAKNPMAKFAGK